MNITCPACDARYRVDDSEIPAGGRALRCSACDAEWSFHPEEEEEALAPLSSSTMSAPAMTAAAAAGAAVAPSAPKRSPYPARPDLQEKRSGGFMAGFVITGLLIALAAGVYLRRDDVVAALPQAAPAVDAYIALVDRGRAELDGLIDRVSEALR